MSNEPMSVRTQLKDSIIKVCTNKVIKVCTTSHDTFNWKSCLKENELEFYLVRLFALDFYEVIGDSALGPIKGHNLLLINKYC